jgi:hypothetical protein
VRKTRAQTMHCVLCSIKIFEQSDHLLKKYGNPE